MNQLGLRPTPAQQTLRRGQQPNRTSVWECGAMSYSLDGLWSVLCRRLVRSRICKAQVFVHGQRMIFGVCYLHQ